MSARVVVTGLGAIAAGGAAPAALWQAAHDGRSAIRPAAEAAASPRPFAGEIADFDPRRLVSDRKLHARIGRTDFFGLFASAAAIDDARLLTARERLPADEANAFNEATGVFAGAGGATYQNQYDFLPVLAATGGDLGAFGREVSSAVTPMWLLRSLPNNVLCHVGIRYGFKGPNSCLTSHAASGALALVDALDAVREGTAERAVVVAHDAPIEAETLFHLHSLGLLARDAVRPFDSKRDGMLLGEGAAAMILESEASAAGRGARVIGEILGGGAAGDAEGLIELRQDGAGIALAIEQALADAGVEPRDVGLVVAHGEGTPASDRAEASAILHAFGGSPPPVTAFKWSFGHAFAASALLDVVLALESLGRGCAPGIATLRESAFPELPVSPIPRPPRSEIALVLARGFGGLSSAIVVRGLPETPP